MEMLLNVIVIWEPILLVRCFNKSDLFGQFYNTFIVHIISGSQSHIPRALLRLNWQHL